MAAEAWISVNNLRIQKSWATPGTGGDGGEGQFSENTEQYREERKWGQPIARAVEKLFKYALQLLNNRRCFLKNTILLA